MYRTAIAVVLLFGPLALTAQSPSTTSTTEFLVSPANIPANATFAGGCRVFMDARQGLWDHTIRVRDGRRERSKENFGQRISLTLVDIHSAQITRATVKVLGLSGHNHMLNTDVASNGSPDMSRIIRITSFSEAKGGVTGEVYAPGFTSVTSIELLEVTYADGSTWSTPRAAACHVTPNPLMLIAGH